MAWDVEAVAAIQASRPIVDVFSQEVVGFSKYQLAKAYLRWTRTHAASDLTFSYRRKREIDAATSRTPEVLNTVPAITEHSCLSERDKADAYLERK